MDPYLGEIRLFSFDFAPVNWLKCDGQQLNISQYDSLYALLGIMYGGNGVTTFALPDLRGRAVIGDGTGINLTTRIQGQALGTETVTLTANNTPQHTHPFQITSTTATLKNPAGNILGAAPGGMYDSSPQTVRPMEDDMIVPDGPTAPSPHSNMQPFIVLNYCICVANGYWPDRP